MFDIVFPMDNEEEFIEIATRLGYTGLVLVYEKKIKTINSKLKILYGGYSGKVDIKILEGFDRDKVERGSIDLVYGIEKYGNRDFMHQKNSGLNHIVTKICALKNVKVGFSFSDILMAKNKSLIIGRIQQNIKLCRKFKAKMVIGSFTNDPYEMRSPEDLIAFFSCIKMTSKEASDALRNIAIKESTGIEYVK